MVQNTERLCQCGFNAEYITDYAFQCFPDSDHQVTFRARLHGTAHATSSRLIEDIEDWVNTTMLISVQGLRVNIDICPVVITSFGDPQCPDETTQPNSQSNLSTQTPIPPTNTKTTSVSITTAALVCGVVAVVLVLVVTVIVITRVIAVSVTKKYSYSTDRDMG